MATVNTSQKLTGIDPKRVVNKEYLNSLGDFYKCSICFNVMVNPTDCEKCGHSYCYDCITRLKCPYNCEPKTLKPSSMGIKALLSTLFFFCENEKCESKVSYSNVLSHDLSCEYQRIICPSTGCNLQLSKRELEKHIKDECVFSLLCCKYCGYEFVRSKIEEHESACSQIFSTLNGDNSVDIANMNIDPKKYLQALSLNISKLIKDNRTKLRVEEDKEYKSTESIVNIIESVLEKKKLSGNEGVSTEMKEEMEKKMQSFEKNINGLNFALEEIKKMIIQRASQVQSGNESQSPNQEYTNQESTNQLNELMMASLLEKVISATELKLNQTINQLGTDLKSQLSSNEGLNTKIDSLQAELIQSNNTQKELKEIVAQPQQQPQIQPQIEFKEIEKVVTVFPELDFVNYFTRIIQLVEQTNGSITNYHKQLTEEIQGISDKIQNQQIVHIHEHKNETQSKTVEEIISSSEKKPIVEHEANIKSKTIVKDEVKIKPESVVLKEVKIKPESVVVKEVNMKLESVVKELKTRQKSVVVKEMNMNLDSVVKKEVKTKPKSVVVNEVNMNLESVVKHDVKTKPKSVVEPEVNIKPEIVVEREVNIKAEGIKNISNAIKNEINEFNDNIKVHISKEIENKINVVNSTVEGINTEMASIQIKVKEIKGMISEEFEDITQLITDSNKKKEEYEAQEKARTSEQKAILEKLQQIEEQKIALEKLKQTEDQKVVQEKLKQIEEQKSTLEKIQLVEQQKIAEEKLKQVEDQKIVQAKLQEIEEQKIALNKLQRIEEQKIAQESSQQIEKQKKQKKPYVNSIYHCIEFNIDKQVQTVKQENIQLKESQSIIQPQLFSTELISNEISTVIKQNILPTIADKLTEVSINEFKTSLLTGLDSKLEGLEGKIEQSIDGRLKAMFSLKWCSECEKVDYFYGFIKCSICQNESCKQCVMLCISCKHLVCKNCSSCPKCGKSYCQVCRIPCKSCNPPKNYCENCIQICSFCKKQICVLCIRQCITCKKFTCEECSKTCKICEKHSCLRCDTSKNFRTCTKCSQTACKECIQQCHFCENETCQKCFVSCFQCKKMSCNKCSHPCGACEEHFCPNCSKDFSKSKCGICHKEFCLSCIKNLRRCKKCSKTSCKECCSQCRKCKNIFCNDCSIECDNCSGHMCSNCTYKCVCDMVVFCEKCLLDIQPIGPHDCVFYGNDSSCFKGIKSRSKIKLPHDFEAKLFLEKFSSEANLLIGLTDNNRFDEDSVTFIDNVWAFKIRTGQKYSSAKSLEAFYNKECREGYSILIAKKNDNLFFRVNSEDMAPAYTLPKKDYWIYIENDAPANTAYVRFVYIRKI